MKLHCHPISPYARKAMIMWRLKGLSVEEIIAHPDGAKGYTGGVNPLGKIPTLIVDAGETSGDLLLVDSPYICAFLDQFGDPLLAAKGEEKWQALRYHALGDGITDAVYNYRYETVRPDALHWPDMITRHETAILQTLTLLESETEHLSTPWNFGNLAIICALDYANYRAGHLGWQARFPKLAAWHATFTDDPYYMATYDYPSE